MNSFDSIQRLNKKAVSDVAEGIGEGLVAGGTLAALSALISDYLEARRQQKKKKGRTSDDTSPDSIVFYTKRRPESSDGTKSAEEACPKARAAKPSLRVQPCVEARDVVYTGAQPRSLDGRFSTLNKDAQLSLSRAWNEGKGLAALILSIPAGYYLVDKLHSRMEEKRLKAQIAAAQREYIDLLSGHGSEKDAEALDDVFGHIPGDGMVKTSNMLLRTLAGTAGLLRDAVSPIENAVMEGPQKGLAATIAALLLTTGASSYITHKILQKKFDRPDDEEKPRKIKKVLFKSGSFEQEIPAEHALFTINFLRDCIRSSTPFEKRAQQFVVNDDTEKWYQRLVAAARRYGYVSPVAYAAQLQKMSDWYRRYLLGISDEQLRLLTPTNVRMYEGYRHGRNTGIDRPLQDEELNDMLRVYANDQYGIEGFGMDDFMQKHPELAGYLAGGAGSTDPAAVKGYAMEYIKKNPEQWFRLLGQKENRDIVNAGVNNWISSWKQHPLVGGLVSLPIIGDLIRNIMRWYATGTERGRRMVARSSLTNPNFGGMTEEQANKFLADRKFQSNGGQDGDSWTITSNVGASPDSPEGFVGVKPRRTTPGTAPASTQDPPPSATPTPTQPGASSPGA